MSFSDRIVNLMQPSSHCYTGGQADATALEQAHAAGVRTVVNLRLPAEMPDFDEPAVARRLDLAYHNLPISGAADFNRANVERLDTILREAGENPVLVHCASGNRVGALFALRAAWHEGKSVDVALEIGRGHGLTKAQGVVRAILEQSGK